MWAPEAALLGLLLAPEPAATVTIPNVLTAPAPPNILVAPAPASAAPAAPPATLFPLAPPADAPPPSAYDLRPAKNGSDTLVYEGPRFTARVSVDGTVTFSAAKPAHPFWWPPFFPVAVDNGRPSLQSTLSSVLRGKKRPTVETDKVVDESFLIIPNVTRYRPDPREGSRASFQVMPLLGNASKEVDLTDALMGLSGQDPYRIEKARFLTATRELRIRRAAHAHAVWIREATAELPKRLAAIAADQRLSVAERRAILEALAAEMDDSPAGRDAAGRIRAFIAKDFAKDFAKDLAPRSP